MSVPPSPRFLDRTTPPHIATLIIMSGLAALSLNIFLPSLPAMARDFGVDELRVNLVVSGYLAMTALIQIVIGPISDRYGRRPVLLGAVAIFTLASLGAALATDFALFMVFRLMQAAIATAFALSRAVVRDMVEPDKAASMIGYVTMGMSVVPMIGPAFGGLLDNVFGWRASFWLLVLAGASLFALVWADQGETATGRPSSFRAQVAAYPALFRSQRFWGYCMASATASGAFFAFLGGASLVGERVYGLSPVALGIAFSAPAFGYMLGNFLSGRFSTRVGINRMMLGGTLITTAGLGLLTVLAFAGLAGPAAFFGLMVSVGLGNGILLPSANAGMLSVRPELAGSAAGLGGAITIGGGASLSALAGWALTGAASAMPLILLMTGTSVASVLAALWVIRRARQVGA
jgi:DHA1 family bicyclomycin/chloramphenicol resistance-like MFS transporter